MKKVSETEIKILTFSRDDRDGYENEKQYPRLLMNEDDRRIVTSVYLMPYDPFNSWAEIERSDYFTAVNPKHVFSYGA